MVFHFNIFSIYVSLFTHYVPSLLMYIVLPCVHYFSCWMPVRSQYPEGPTTGHLGTGFSWFPCVYKRMLRWFPTLPVATACFSCSPPDLNFLDHYFIFMYMHNNHCHRVKARLQLKILLLLLLLLLSSSRVRIKVSVGITLTDNFENNARRSVYCSYHTVYQGQCGTD